LGAASGDHNSEPAGIKRRRICRMYAQSLAMISRAPRITGIAVTVHLILILDQRSVSVCA
jgi:hypothetical protein